MGGRNRKGLRRISDLAAAARHPGLHELTPILERLELDEFVDQANQEAVR